MGTQLHPPQKGGRAPTPIFGPCLLCPNCWMDQGGTWHGGGPWSRPHCARWGHSSPFPKKDRAPPQFLVHATSIVAKRLDGLRPLGTEVHIGPGHFVLDGFPAIGERGTAAPLFSAHAFSAPLWPGLLLAIITTSRPIAIAILHEKYCNIVNNTE